MHQGPVALSVKPFAGIPVTSFLTKLFAPFFAARLTKATLKHRVAPNTATTVELAWALLRAGKTNEAFATITSARKAYPEDSRVRTAYSSIRTRYAKTLLTRTLEELKSDSRVENHVRAAELFRTLGQSEKALSLLERLQGNFPEDWSIEFAIGQVYFSRFRESNHPADLTEAVSRLEQARQKGGDNYKVRYFLALVCAHASQHRKALEVLEAILADCPADARALALRHQVEKAVAEIARSKAAEDTGDGLLDSAASSAGSDATRVVSRLVEEAGVTGVFAFNDDGEATASSFRPGGAFDLTDGSAHAWSLVESCKSDAGHIGVGSVNSCVLEGTDWQILLRLGAGHHLVVFLDGSVPASQIEAKLDQSPVEVC